MLLPSQEINRNFFQFLMMRLVINNLDEKSKKQANAAFRLKLLVWFENLARTLLSLHRLVFAI